MAANKAVVGGLIVVGVVVVLGGWWWFGGNTEAPVTLGNNPCAVTKDDQITVKKGKKVTWKIQNNCTSAQAVSIGNFRSTATGGTACAVGADWPFKNTDNSVTIQPGQDSEIVLKEAKNSTGTSITLYYDFCLGGVPKDPRLIIDP